MAGGGSWILAVVVGDSATDGREEGLREDGGRFGGGWFRRKEGGEGEIVRDFIMYHKCWLHQYTISSNPLDSRCIMHYF